MGAGRATLMGTLLASLCGCAAMGEATWQSRERASAEARLAGCLGWSVGARPLPLQRQACVEESKVFCRERGLESSCGMGGLWTRVHSSSR